MKKIKMDEMTWMEFNARIKEGAVTILPIGACEQHGPHLPLCVDTVLANGFATRLAERINAIVAPTINYGYKSKPLSGGGPLFPGTVDLNGSTLVNLTYDVLEELKTIDISVLTPIEAINVLNALQNKLKNRW